MSDQKIIPIAIEDEVKESYLNYAMSVIVSRALPDIRDGLKPVHRRILYSMNEMGLRHDKAYKKCGRIVGDVLGKFHPHGDQSIYDALVRLAQDFSLRIPVVQGQGNFGSVDGDPPAAMRYTEARLAKIAEEMLKDINKETVDFGPNYDDTMQEPTVLPGGFPYLMVNGASGIAVGMATNIPPHNLREVCNGIAAVIDNPEITIDEILDYIQGPDFPTQGVIFGRNGIRKAAYTGRGKITVRANYDVEELKNDKQAIIITELPYQVNKANLIIHIANLVRDKKIEGITDLRDESDRNGMRIVIEVKRGFPPKVVLNNLFAHTSLQSNFNVNALALSDGKPKLLNYKDMIEGFIKHRKEVITRRTIFDLKKAKEKAHILEGLKKAIENIDEVIQIIKSSSNVKEAKTRLIERFKFSERQAQAILDMRLQKITSLETKKIVEELEETLKLIDYLEDLLAHEEKILQLIKDETLEIAEKHGEDRRTNIDEMELNSIDIEDFIKKEDMAMMLTNKGFIKRTAVSEYKAQGRGGKGSNTSKLKEDDILEHFFIASTHSHVLFITNLGKAYWVKGYEIPEGSKTSRGKHISTVLPFEQDECITETVIIDEFTKDKYIFMATKNGVVKRVNLHDFRNAKIRGIKAILLDEGDNLMSALLTDGNQDIVMISQNGKALRIDENQVRCMGRTSRGCRGMKLKENDTLIGVCRVTEDKSMLVLSELGYGKRVDYSEFSNHARGTQGQKIYTIQDKTGLLIKATDVSEESSLISITSLGKALRFAAEGVSKMGRAAFGVRIVNLNDGDSVIGLACQEEKDEEEEEVGTEEISTNKENSIDQKDIVENIDSNEESSDSISTEEES